MTNNRSETYMGTVLVSGGALVEGEELSSARFYVKTLNANRANPNKRWVLRYRYRGKRRPGHAGRCMCLKKDATRADMYLYNEYI